MSVKLTDTGKAVAICLGFWFVMFLFVCSRTSCRGAEVKLRWNRNPDSDLIMEYHIYRGIELLTISNGTEAVVDLPIDSRSTLSLRAVNANGMSLPANLTLIPYTPRFSTDLKTWVSRPNRVVFAEAAPSLFANYSYPLQ